MLLADVCMLLSLIIGTLLYFCVHLSPLLNMIVNIPILLLWTVGFGLIIWNMFGALGNSCDAWGNDDGKKVCHTYKALFSFVVIGWLCQVALIVLDVRARRNQSILGRYNKMNESQQDLKLNALDHSRDSSVNSVHDVPLGTGLDGAAQRMNTQQERPAVERAPSQRSLLRQDSYYSSAPSYTTQPVYKQTYQDTPYASNQDLPSQPVYQAYNPNTRFEPTYNTGQSFGTNDFSHQAPPQQTQYNNYYAR
jgi:hypothetical protein